MELRVGLEISSHSFESVMPVPAEIISRVKHLGNHINIVLLRGKSELDPFYIAAWSLDHDHVALTLGHGNTDVLTG